MKNGISLNDAETMLGNIRRRRKGEEKIFPAFYLSIHNTATTTMLETQEDPNVRRYTNAPTQFRQWVRTFSKCEIGRCWLSPISRPFIASMKNTALIRGRSIGRILDLVLPERQEEYRPSSHPLAEPWQGE